jgi:hypothetical protein
MRWCAAEIWILFVLSNTLYFAEIAFTSRPQITLIICKERPWEICALTLCIWYGDNCLAKREIYYGLTGWWGWGGDRYTQQYSWKKRTNMREKYPHSDWRENNPLCSLKEMKYVRRKYGRQNKMNTKYREIQTSVRMYCLEYDSKNWELRNKIKIKIKIKKEGQENFKAQLNSLSR